METTQIHKTLLQRLVEVRNKGNRIELLFGLSITLLAAILSITFFSVLEELFHTGTTFREIFFYTLLIGNIGFAIWNIGIPLLKLFRVIKHKTEEELSIQIGTFFPQIKDTLRNALQLIREREKNIYSVDLIDASLRDLYKIVSPLDFLSSVDTTQLKRIQKKLVSVCAVSILVIIISPTSFFSAFNRMLHYDKIFDSQTRFVFHIEPGNKEIVRGENVPVKISIEESGIALSNYSNLTLTLHKRSEGQVNYEAQTLRKGNDGNYSTEFSLVKIPLWYYAEFQNIKSNEFAISVVDKPIIRNFSIKISPPKYTQLPEKELDESNGDIVGYKGTRISLSINSSKELAKANLVFNDSTRMPMNINGKQCAISFSLLAEKTYHVEIEDNDKLKNADPIEYHLQIVPDEFPSATIITPGKNIDADESMKLAMLFELKDDFGFSKLRLGRKLVHSKIGRAHV